MNHSCDVRPEDLGPYALGQLDPAEAARVRDQIAHCPACTDQLQELALVVRALEGGTPPPDEVEHLNPPTTALRAVLGSVRRWRRRRALRRAALVAAVVVVAVGVGLGQRLLDDAATVALAGQQGAAGEARLDTKSWGTQVQLDVSGLDPGVLYGVWLAAADGSRSSAGTFRPGEDGDARLSMSVGLALGDSAQVGVSRLPAQSGGEVVDVLQARLGPST